MPKSEALVRLFPLPDASIPGVPAIEQDVTEAEAKRLLAYVPAAFTVSLPSGAVSSDTPDQPPPLDGA